jgi:hypothetical protein
MRYLCKKNALLSNDSILFITPPFTQLNTPYPATAYLKGFLNTLGMRSHQVDLGLEVILALFSQKGLQEIFDRLLADDRIELSEGAFRTYQLRAEYLNTIDPVIQFLQNKNPVLAHAVCSRAYLPEGARFQDLDDLDWAFGTMGLHDKARHLATLYLEDIGDLIAEAIDPYFGFSRYAERLCRSATHFDPIYAALNAESSLVSKHLTQLLEQKMQQWHPTVVCLSVPFPGNLFSAFKCGQYLKKHYPAVKIIMGGGYCNTELRSVSDERVFEFTDYICIDDGEAPLQFLLEYLQGKRPESALKRVFSCKNGVVCYHNGAVEKDVPQRETGTPDYSDLLLHAYLSVIEVANPMHRLWSDGRWNKLTLAHGCYWGKCSFCDISLDYIRRYEPLTADILCDRIETIIAQTGQPGFHFVDEAAPPALLRDLSLEIVRRKLTVVWWVNIRFEKSFTPDLCRLMKAAGCIAVSGGLEVASDRLLAKMQKGVTVAQVARVSAAFTEAGMMVHAYLMYGFPTQTAQETVDALEMVRQMFQAGVLQSGFWHLFAMTAHSPVGLDPMAFGVVRVGPDPGGFADNDLAHDDPEGADHELFSEGLRKSLFNYMHGAGFDLPLAKWFDFKIPKTSIAPDYIEKCLLPQRERDYRTNAIVVWMGYTPEYAAITPAKGRRSEPVGQLIFSDKKQEWALETHPNVAKWLQGLLPQMHISQPGTWTLKQLQQHFEAADLGYFSSFHDFLQSYTFQELQRNGLLVV